MGETSCDDREVRTVCVELVRPGPAHNQLLSPLTRYLALCGDAQACEVSVEYEHAEFIRRLRDLRYRREADPDRASQANDDRQAALLDLSRSMSRLLAGVPGLRGQLHPRGCGDELVHLQMVVTAAELAMLPLELSGTLESQGNEPGNFLLLNPSPRVSMTRRVRSVSESCVHWPDQPRVLFVSAGPERPVPFDAHKDALLRTLQRWLPPLGEGASDPEKAADEYMKALGSQLTIIEKATIADIADACAKQRFTHIHVLAHGAPDPNSPGRHFGIALHSVDRGDEAHVVSGAQFATAIRRDGGQGGPTVVTVAACDSGNVNEVLYTGASFLHDLHRSGVPLVIGSQFPLSVRGSEEFCERLYAGLLWGDDPRQLLADLRLRLHSLYSSTNHDWASLVAYAVFPEDLETELVTLRYRQSRRALNVALDHLDRAVDWMADERTATATPGSVAVPVSEPAIARIRERVENAARQVPTTGPFITEGFGLVAASNKRCAEALFKAAPRAGGREGNWRRDSVKLLEVAHDLYACGFQQGVRFRSEGTHAIAPLHWALTQQLSLAAVLGKGVDPELFATARSISINDLAHDERVAEIWALTSLMELDLLGLWQDLSRPIAGVRDASTYQDSLSRSTERLLTLVPDDNIGAVYSTLRQFQRYTTWWWTDAFTQTLPPRQDRLPLRSTDAVRPVLEQIVTRLRDFVETHQGGQRAPATRAR